MSFEGFNQFLCRNGHYDSCDIYEEEKSICKCGEPFVWTNLVDLTNGSYYEEERVDGYVQLETITLAKHDTCNLGHKHEIVEATYKIPDNRGRMLEHDF